MKKIVKIAIGTGIGIVVGSTIACLIKSLKNKCERLDSDMFEDEMDNDEDFEDEDAFEEDEKDGYIPITPKKEEPETIEKTSESKEKTSSIEALEEPSKLSEEEHEVPSEYNEEELENSSERSEEETIQATV